MAAGIPRMPVTTCHQGRPAEAFAVLASCIHKTIDKNILMLVIINVLPDVARQRLTRASRFARRFRRQEILFFTRPRGFLRRPVNMLLAQTRVETLTVPLW